MDCKGFKAPRVYKASKVSKGCRELKVRRVLKDLLALPGQQGPRVLRVRPALTVSPALQVQLVLKELQVRKAPKDPQESQGSPARLVRRAQPELTE